MNYTQAIFYWVNQMDVVNIELKKPIEGPDYGVLLAGKLDSDTYVPITFF
jgi:hypothetical protein